MAGVAIASAANTAMDSSFRINSLLSHMILRWLIRQRRCRDDRYPVTR
jgi:hypothetical protein